jgi:hypothetical protein
VLFVHTFTDIDIEVALLDTAASALTGRHLPAARERFPPVRSESCAARTFFQPGFSGAQAMK